MAAPDSDGMSSNIPEDPVDSMNYVSWSYGTLECLPEETCWPAGNGACKSTECVAFEGMDEV